MNEYSSIITASNFVSTAFLLSFGAVIIIVGLLIINNLIVKFWKPMGISEYIHNTLNHENTPNKKVDNLDS